MVGTKNIPNRIIIPVPAAIPAIADTDVPKSVNADFY